ncbi:MAG: response regulator transcription factor [Sterolibacterium sp.]|jgi:two-component system OmpR family response regulator/two-component system response regulator CpxR
MNTNDSPSTPINVLLIDDDTELVDLIRDYLSREGFVVTCTYNGIEGAEAALSGKHDIVVLDVMMPGCDGFLVLAKIRASSSIPVLMLTARGDDGDRVTGLEHGADDYVSKPCSPRELTARLRAILKRVMPVKGSGMSSQTENSEGQPITLGSFSIWPAQRRATDHDRPLELTSTEFSVLEVFARNAGKIVSKEDLSQQALGRPMTRFDRSIDVHIHSIRNKLQSLEDGRSRIQTVIRKGYQLLSG